MRVFGPTASFCRAHSSRRRSRASASGSGAPGSRQDGRQDRLVEVVASEAPHPFARDDLVRLPRHPEERGVERAAAEVVDEDVLAPRRDRRPEAVGVLEAGRRRLVQERHGREAGRAERLQRQEALRARGVRGDRDRRLERLPLRDGGVRAGEEVLPHLREEPGEEVEEEDGTAPDLDRGARAGVGEEPLERADEADSRLVPHGHGVEAVPQLAGREEGGERRVGISPLEGDHGVVPAVDHRHHRVGRPEVDAEAHADVEFTDFRGIRRQAGPRRSAFSASARGPSPRAPALRRSPSRGRPPRPSPRRRWRSAGASRPARSS